MTTSQLSRSRLRAAQRRQRAVELRLKGKTFDQIGRAIGVTKMAAWTMVNKELGEVAKATAETAELLRDVEARRLEEMTEKAHGLMQASSGDLRLRAIATLVKVSERRAKLLGLDRPTRVQIEDFSALSDEQLAALAAGEDPARVVTMTDSVN